MKAELINLLERLQNSGEGFHSLVVFPRGQAVATYRYTCRPFKSLEELEHFAYSQPDPTATVQPAANPATAAL